MHEGLSHKMVIPPVGETPGVDKKKLVVSTLNILREEEVRSVQPQFAHATGIGTLRFYEKHPNFQRHYAQLNRLQN